LAINLLFGSALSTFRLVSKFAAPPRPSITLGGGTQLENGGTESGQIRFIVWRGALDVFKHYPIFGSGLETFAYSYYQFRPIEHNMTSEWDFLYNKAHNEYLNYMATTGIVGFGTYILIIGAFLIWGFFNLKLEIFNLNSNFKLKIKNYKPLDANKSLFVLTLLASYISYLIYNFFLFSVVIIAVFFYLFPAIAFVAAESTQAFKWPKKLYPIPNTLYPILYRRPLYTKSAKTIVILFAIYLIFSIFQLWYADILFSEGSKANDLGKSGTAYYKLQIASELNKGEPFYKSELANAAASAAVAYEVEDATISAQLVNKSAELTEELLKNYPYNVSFFRSAVTTYFQLSLLDEKFTENTLSVLDSAINLAPTDPKLYYNKGLVLYSLGKKDEAINFYKKALELKPNYIEAQTQLNEATSSGK